MSRGRVESAAEQDPFFAQEVDNERWRSKPEKPRDKPAPTYTVLIKVEGSGWYDQTWWTLKEYDSKDRALHLVEEISRVVHEQLGIMPERLED